MPLSCSRPDHGSLLSLLPCRTGEELLRATKALSSLTLTCLSTCVSHYYQYGNFGIIKIITLKWLGLLLEHVPLVSFEHVS